MVMIFDVEALMVDRSMTTPSTTDHVIASDFRLSAECQIMSRDLTRDDRCPQLSSTMYSLSWFHIDL